MHETSHRLDASMRGLLEGYLIMVPTWLIGGTLEDIDEQLLLHVWECSRDAMHQMYKGINRSNQFEP